MKTEYTFTKDYTHHSDNFTSIFIDKGSTLRKNDDGMYKYHAPDGSCPTWWRISKTILNEFINENIVQ